MPEAVIVATARSPIGRAFKGSLTSIRPDELLTQIVSAALAKVPGLDPASIDDLIVGCGLPGGEQGFNIARVVAVMLGYDTLPGTTVNRYCSSSLQTTRMAYHAIKAGEGDVFISAGVECVSRSVHGSSDSWPDTKNPVFAAAQEGTVGTAAAELPWHDPRADGASEPDTMAGLAIGLAPGGTGGPPPGGQLPDVYIAMGQTAENVAAQRGDVLRGLAHRDVDVGQLSPGGRTPRTPRCEPDGTTGHRIGLCLLYTSDAADDLLCVD